MPSVIQGIRNKELAREFTLRPPQSVGDLNETITRYIASEENETWRAEQDRILVDAVLKNNNKRKPRSPDRGQPEEKKNKKKEAPMGKYSEYTPLNTSREQVFMETKEQAHYKKPRPMITPKERRNSKLYCHYHQEIGHSTERCRQLKDVIETKIRDGQLSKYTSDGGRRGSSSADPQKKPQEDEPVQREIFTIHGGVTRAGSTKSQRREHVREVMQTASRPQKRPAAEPAPVLTFTDEDAVHVSHPHDDALVITAIINNCKIHRILVDSGSSADIVFRTTFQKMGLSPRNLRPYPGPLTGFTGHSTPVEGVLTLMVQLGEPPRRQTAEIDFMVVDIPSAYNVIFGRNVFYKFRAVMSIYHLCIKFPTLDGEGIVRGDQGAARQCYQLALKEQSRKAKPLTAGAEPRSLAEDEKLNPDEPTLPVQLSEDPAATVQVSSLLPEPFRLRLIKLLKENSDIFATKPSDMTGISRQLAEHRLFIQPGVRPVRQRKRLIAPDRQQIVDQEVQKLLAAGFVREVYYPDWLANIVLVSKHNGKWRMCVDFTDLNKVCPKDSYPLPNIDQLVDSTAGHQLLSFLDAFSGYHQIKMHKDDEEKTSFVTHRGTYCYTAMPFGLKNAGATYQRLVNKIFENQIGRNMEVYVDDMLVKSRHSHDHLDDLAETFTALRSHNMKLNPQKCVFGVSAGKFLGFMISQRGIEANPEKIRALQDMKAPRGLKEVQRLAGRVASLHRFIPKSSDRCLPFFQLLKQGTRVQWTPECDQAFHDLKIYLQSPPLLVKPTPCETLLLYLAVSASAVSSVLTASRVGGQHPVYFISKTLQGAEHNYSPIEKLALALLTTARKLRPYFQAHPIKVITEYPLRQSLHKPETSGRLMKWSIELSQYSIEYAPKTAIKSQVLADFVAEFTEDYRPAREQSWTLHTDGSACRSGGGLGIVIKTPEGTALEYAVRLNFPATNNVAEYEALLTGLRILRYLGIRHVHVFADSALVVNQAAGKYLAKDPTIALYVAKAKEIAEGFGEIKYTHIPRSLNTEADLLAKMASSGLAEHPIILEEQSKPSIEETQVAEINAEPIASDDWRTPIIRYIRDGIVPENKAEAKALRHKSANYALDDGVLYRRSLTHPYQRCLGPDEASAIMAEIHDGECGDHQGWRCLTGKILRMGYYWPTLRADATDFVQKCVPCQKFANIPRVPPTRLTPVVEPWPFAQWGIDILGPLPTATGKRKFLVVAVDYFTKWAEAKALASIETGPILNFAWENLMCRFGMPHALVTDHGKQFTSQRFELFCHEHGIKHKLVSVAHPQANGQVEVTNRTLLNLLKKRLERFGHEWVTHVPATLWAYNTTARVPTGETPFRMSHGWEAMAPVELALPTLRQINYAKGQNEALLAQDSDLAEDVRDQARLRLMRYQQQMARYYNSRVKDRRFNTGQLVWRKAEASSTAPKGKMAPNWEGPYRIAESVFPGTYRLDYPEGGRVPGTWHASHLKAHYA